MKRQNYFGLRLMATFSMAMLFFIGVKAENVKFNVVTEAPAYVVYNQSANGRYVVLNNALQIFGNRPAIYDNETKTLTYIGYESFGWADGVSNDGTVVGQFLDDKLLLDGQPIYSGCTWKDGKLTSLGLNPKYGINKLFSGAQGSNACVITPDGKYIAGYTYINSHTLVPTVWKDGVWEKDFYIDPADPDDEWQEFYQGARAWDISDDGQRVCGWGTKNHGVWGGNMWYPMLWTSAADSEDSYITTPVDEDKYWLYLKRMNSTGTIAVGDAGLVMKDNGEYKYIGSNWLDVSDNGIMVGSQIYSEESGLMSAATYLLKYHGIDIQGYSMLTISAISPDGKKMAGTAFGYDSANPWGTWFPVTFDLNGTPLPVAPNGIKTAAGSIAKTVTVTWSKPNFIYDPIGYNVYRDGTKVNSTLIDALSFVDENAVLGKCCYSVTAVYNIEGSNVESGYGAESCIEVIDENGCYSPKKLVSEIIYNRTVNLSWGLPTPNYVNGEMKGSDVAGYNVYRNGVKMNTDLLTERRYSENVIAAGDYSYTVTTLFSDDCESNMSKPVMVTINPIGTCLPPTKLSVETIRNNAIITWNAPEYQEGINVIGYDLYKNDVKVNDKWITDVFYVDSNLELGGYWYKVRAFYDNSCESTFTEPILCELYGCNPVLPPTNLTIDIVSDSKATLSWKVPPMGNYETLKWYDGNKEWEIGMDEGGPFYVGCKWEASDLIYYYDYSLTDIEFYPTINIPHTFYVYIDGKLVATKEMSSVRPQEFNILKLDNPILVEKGKSLMVAYKVVHAEGERPVGADMMMGIDGKGNLMSTDGQTWENASIYGLWANWAITIRLAPYSVSPAKSIVCNDFEVNSSETVTLSGNRESKQVATSMFVNNEVFGYNVFKGEEQLNYDFVETTTYTVDIDKTKNECFSVSAYFSNGRGSERTPEVCTYGDCNAAKGLEGEVTTIGSVELTWEAPIVTPEYDEYMVQYHNGIKADAVGFGVDLLFYPVIRCTPINYPNFTDLALTKITAFINDDCEVWLFAAQGGNTILNQKVNNIRIGEFNTFIINDNGIKIDASKDLYVGLVINAKAYTFPIGIDGMPAIINRGDVVSEDGESFYSMTLGSGGTFNSNWSISATFENRMNAKSSFVENRKTMANKLDVNSLIISGEKTAVGNKGAVNEIVVGYDVYRDGEKVNKELIEKNSYSDVDMQIGKEHSYYVKTLWNTGCYDNQSETIKILHVSADKLESDNISIYPNPAKSVINIVGEYECLRITDISGATVKRVETGDKHIMVSELNAGVYFVEIVKGGQVVKYQKIIITK